jgi:hypothetical protein
MIAPKKSFMASNPERLMIVAFPLITLGLFLVGALLFSLVQWAISA